MMDSYYVYVPGVFIYFAYTCHAVLTVEFSSPDYSVPEKEDTVTLCLQTDTGSNKPVSVIISTISKTATG